MYLNKFQSTVLLFLLLFFSCSEAPVSEKIEEKSNHSPSEVTAVPVSKKETSPIGKRTAEEMVEAGFKRYGIEKGILLFRIDGAMKGMDALYFDHWGWREGKYNMTDAEVGAYKKKNRSVQYLDGERRYQYEPGDTKAYFFESTQIQTVADKYNTTDMTIVGDEMIKDMGGEPAGKAEVMGVECDVWVIEKTRTTLYMWNGITMKEHSFTGGIPVTRRCVQLDTTGVIDLAKMTLPEVVELEDVGMSGSNPPKN